MTIPNINFLSSVSWCFVAEALKTFQFTVKLSTNWNFSHRGWELLLKVYHYFNWFVDINDVLTLQCNWHAKRSSITTCAVIEQKQNHRRIQSWIRLCLSNKPATYLLLFIWFTRELDYKVCTALTIMKINTKFLSMLKSWSGVCHLTWRQNWMIT